MHKPTNSATEKSLHHNQERPKPPQLQLKAVQTPAAVPLAPLILKSTNVPAPTATHLPVAVHVPPVPTEQPVPVSTMLPGIPAAASPYVPACCEYTVSFVAVHPPGTHVSTAPHLDALAFVVVHRVIRELNDTA